LINNLFLTVYFRALAKAGIPVLYLSEAYMANKCCSMRESAKKRYSEKSTVYFIYICFLSL
ncbi:hypothetical protein, partial [Phascolarctobacterium faecium]|uniref:hypothetical protein n=1 Tax=Phascolarctobacterium faecium TaxID=33025 RepID=UPI003AB35080